MDAARHRVAAVMRCAAMALALMLAILPAWAAQAPVPALTTRVTDTTNTLDQASRTRIEQTLALLEQEKGAQIAVLMVPTTGDEAIEQYATRAFEHWKLGRKGVDDGILFLVAKDDRRMRIEVGYGLEAAVPDLLAGRIIREQVAPRFQQGDFAGGVVAGVDSLATLVRGEDLPAPQAPTQVDDDSPAFMLLPLAIMAFIMPPLFAMVGIGFFSGLLFESVGVGVLGGIVALLISLVGRVMGAGGKGGAVRASRRGGVVGGFGGGFGGGGSGGGGFGGGGFGGGGGGSGGGGASGGW